MTLSEISIRRPVLSTIIMLIILIMGFIGYTYLGVREYPNIDNPIITVNVSYPGANAEVIMNQISEPLEQNLNGIPGIRSMTSASSQGSCRITIEFELSVDLETAANDVRDKVSAAQRRLPRDSDPPTVTKADSDSNPIMQVSIRSEKRSLLELSEIADLTVKEQLQTIQNVSSVDIWGEAKYSMRLWLDPVKMASYKITPLDVKNAIDKENVELPAGSIEGDEIELSIRTMGLMQSPEEFNNLIIKEENTRVIRFRDIGVAELGAENMKTSMRVNGVPQVGVVIIPQPGANQIDISDEAHRRIEFMKKDLPDDVEIEVVSDDTRFVRASIREVEETIIIAFILVVIIIFLFLRDWRVTLVPCVVIPMSLIGAFFVMYLGGFSINVLSMLAIVLSVGLVVDDAIVVTENIYQKIEGGMTPLEAGIEGSKEIFFAVISTTITLVAVFFPIVFLEGMTGRLFREFSIVISGAVIISSFVALTFTPMLATKLLKRREKQNWFYRKTEPFFIWLNNIYSRSLAYFLKNRYLTWPIMVGTLAVIWLLGISIPSEMAPLEDRSQITVRVSAPEGATFEYYRDFVNEISHIEDSLVPEKRLLISMARAGFGFSNVILQPIQDRERSQMEIANQLTAALSKRTEARAFVQQQSTFGGRRATMPVQYVLQAQNLRKLEEHIPRFMDQVNASGLFRMADVNLKFTKPETQIFIDRDKAAMLGVSTNDLSQTLQYALSSQRMGYFYMNGKQYQILGEINRQQRNTPLDLKTIYLKNSRGDMIQMDNLVELRETVAPPTLYRYNRFNAATVSAGLAPGVTIGQALDEMDHIAAEVLDDTFRTTLSGESKEFRESSSSLMFAFILAVFLIFLILAAQFESFKDPFVIMLTVPLAIAGALVFMYLSGVTMNIFSQIGIIMLIGLVVKNGILIVEFANQRQQGGMDKLDSIQGAAVQRLRPILMTSFSSILGMLPLVFASGEGANGRIAMGTAVVGGLVVSTLISMFIVPAMYMYISTDRRKRPQALPEPVLMVEGAGAVPVEVAVSVDEVADTAAGNEETVNPNQE
ncbi:MAG: efflux RND transporter permease subunit [Alistipes sp.]|nr:efflux RND transporter permease subunit [Alistipes sp.]